MKDQRWQCKVCGAIVTGIPPQGGISYLDRREAFGRCESCKSGGRSFRRVK